MQNFAKESFRIKIQAMILTADDDEVGFWQQVLKEVEDSWRVDERYIERLESRIAELESEQRHAEATYYRNLIEELEEDYG